MVLKVVFWQVGSQAAQGPLASGGNRGTPVWAPGTNSTRLAANPAAPPSGTNYNEPGPGGELDPALNPHPARQSNVIPELPKIIILAIVQGIAEFLPISSSGHLVVLSEWFDDQGASAELNIVLHFGTLLAILVFYRQRIAALLTRDRKVIPWLVLGTIPAAVVGIWIKLNHEWVLQNALLAGFMLVITGFMLMSLTLIPPGRREYTELGPGRVLFIGCVQAFALLPGISRSGATIVAGCLVGLKRQSSATFSFLLAIPAIAGASLLEAREIAEHGTQTPAYLLALGVLISFGVGLFSLNWLVRWIERGQLHYFAYWLLPLGFSIVIWQLYEIMSRAATG